MGLKKVFVDRRVEVSSNTSSVAQNNTIELNGQIRRVIADGSVAKTVDLNGKADGLVLDLDGDTTISSPTDDQIDIEVNGADDFKITANTFTALSGSTIATNTIAETTAANGIQIDGLTIKDSRLEYNATGYFGVTKTADTTLTIDETGFIFGNKSTALVLTLPATVAGYSYFVVNINGAATIALSPNASDYVGGAGLTKVDNKDLIIPAVKGAYAQIIADGVNGWYIAQASGTLTKEG